MLQRCPRPVILLFALATFLVVQVDFEEVFQLITVSRIIVQLVVATVALAHVVDAGDRFIVRCLTLHHELCQDLATILKLNRLYNVLQGCNLFSLDEQRLQDPVHVDTLLFMRVQPSVPLRLDVIGKLEDEVTLLTNGHVVSSPYVLMPQEHLVVRLRALSRLCTSLHNLELLTVVMLCA